MNEYGRTFNRYSVLWHSSSYLSYKDEKKTLPSQFYSNSILG